MLLTVHEIKDMKKRETEEAEMFRNVRICVFTVKKTHDLCFPNTGY